MKTLGLPRDSTSAQDRTGPPCSVMCTARMTMRPASAGEVQIAFHSKQVCFLNAQPNPVAAGPLRCLRVGIQHQAALTTTRDVAPRRTLHTLCQGLPEKPTPSRTRSSWRFHAGPSVCIARRPASQPSCPAGGSASRRATMLSGSSVSCTTNWVPLDLYGGAVCPASDTHASCRFADLKHTIENACPPP